jgi:hypothetical protein
MTAVERRLTRLTDQIAAKHRQIAEHDQSDHVGLVVLTRDLRTLADEVSTLEERWLEISERVDSHSGD